MKFLSRSIAILMLPLLTACGGFEKDVDITLPDSEQKLVVECYIEKNKPVMAAIMESQPYFGTDLSKANPFLGDSVRVEISDGLNTYPLRYQLTPVINPLTKNIQLYNYVLGDSLKLTEGVTYSLLVEDKKGRRVTAEARMLPIVPIDSVTVKPAGNGAKGRWDVTAYFQDPEGDDYFRFRLRNMSDTQRVLTSYATRPTAFSNNRTALGGGGEFDKGDTLEVMLSHITPEYFEFLNTSSAARNANGNPFAQPASIHGNIKGGIGIFTILSSEKKYATVP